MAHYTYLTNKDIGDQSMEGYDCYDLNGDKVGDVDGVITDESMTPRYVVVNSGGLFSTKQYVVPFGEIAHVNDSDKRVEFKTLSKDTFKNGTYPEFNDQWWDQNNHTAWTGHERQVAQAYGRTPQERIDYSSDLYRRPEDSQRLQLMEEQLRANKEQFEAGKVRLGKRITEHTETMNVPVREERVVIERTPVEGRPAAGRELRAGETVEVPVMKERVNVQKESVVREEVGVRKEATERTQQVQDTVRREELDVKDGQGLTSDAATTMDERQRRMTTGEGPRPSDAAERQRTGTGNEPPRR